MFCSCSFAVGQKVVWVVQGQAFSSLPEQDGLRVSDKGAHSHLSLATILSIFLISLLPLLVTPVIPTIDFYNHVARYYVLTHLDEHVALRENYALAWKLLPNLGLDVLALPFFRISPPLAAAKAIIIMLFAVQYGGVLVLSRALNGRVTLATALLAGILLYSYIFVWGFANFLLGNGLSFWCLALWLRLRERNLWLASLVCSIFAGVIFLCHGFAFALYGIMLSMLEFGRWRLSRPRQISGLIMPALAAAIQAVVPAILFRMTPTAQAGQSAEAILAHHDAPGSLLSRMMEIGLYQVNAIVRVADSSWLVLDAACLVFILGFGIWAARKGLIRLAPVAFPLVLVTVILCVVTPPSLFGVGKIAERIPLVCALLVTAALGVGAGWNNEKGRSVLITGLVLIFLLRVGANMIGFMGYNDDYADFAAVVQKAPADVVIGPASPPETRDRITNGRRCEMYPPLVVPLFGHPAPLFANPTQQPLALKGELAELTSRAKLVSTSHDDPLAASQPGFRYYLACDYPTEQIAGFSTLARAGRFMLLERQ